MWAPEECRGYIRQRAPESAAVLPPKFCRVGNKYLWELRILRIIVFPDGITKVGDEWFKNSDINQAFIADSVKEIGMNAFEKCKHLQTVVLTDAS